LSTFAIDFHAGRSSSPRVNVSPAIRFAGSPPIEPNRRLHRLMHRIGAKGPVMRILGILTIVALSWFGQPAFAHAATGFAMAADQAAADAAAGMDWMLFNLRLKFVLLFVITAAIAALAHLGGRKQQNRHGDFAPVRVS
jgi:hypothetical protein